MKHLVLMVIGDDRPGLVESLAQTVARHEGNWLESRMSHLAGHFAGVVRVAVSRENERALMGALSGLKASGLEVRVKVSGASSVGGRSGGQLVEITVMGQDRSGIVSEVSQAIAGVSANVEEFSSEVVSAPMSGEPMFRASAEVWVGDAEVVDGLTEALEGISEDLVVDVVLRDSE